jgi:hypothetical protein
MVILLGILVVLGVTSAIGAVWDRLHRHSHIPVAPSAGERARAQQTVDYYAKVWDSTSN